MQARNGAEGIRAGRSPNLESLCATNYIHQCKTIQELLYSNQWNRVHRFCKQIPGRLAGEGIAFENE